MTPADRTVVLGLRANAAQFALLVAVNAFVGGMVGLERTVVPLLGEAEFGLTSRSAVLSFIVTFGITKAIGNLVGARLAERWGRKPVLVLGWLLGLPVPFLLIEADRWWMINLANVLLGANQALAWSMTVVMKVDLVGPGRRGLALGLNEFAGYLAVGATAWATGYLAATYGLRPEPFYPGIGFAAAGLVLSLVLVRDTTPHARAEMRELAAARRSAGASGPPLGPPPAFGEAFRRASWKEPALLACCQAGLVNNLNDGMSWGIYPLFFAAHGLGLAGIGVVKALYPASWGVLQALFGPLSDRIGRKRLIAWGMVVQAAGIWLTVLVPRYGAWIAGALLQGTGTAMVYPTLLAAVGDATPPSWRATALGIYRFWRDLGYAAGALLAGIVGDLAGLGAAIHLAAALTLASGLTVALRMPEPRRHRVEAASPAAG